MAYVDWIKIEHTTPDKQEVLQMAEILNMNPYEVLGRLIKVWIWADQNLKDGNTSVTSLLQISHIAGVTKFGEAMEQSGWLSRHEGKLVFPNFLRHNGKSAKTRADTQKRVRQSRSCNSSVTDLSQECNAETVTRSSSTSTSTFTLVSNEGGMGETILSDNIFQDLPEVLATDSFKSEWRSWETYLRKTHRTLQPMQRLPAWLNLLERAPPGGEVAFGITTIRQAMAAGWKNLYPQEEKKHERTSVHRRDPSKSAGGGRYEGIKPKINGFSRSTDRPADTGQATPIQRGG